MNPRFSTPARGRTAPEPTFVVRVFERGREPAEYRCRAAGIVIGSEPSCDLWLDGPGIALRHLEVRPDSRAGFVAVDLGGEEGTWSGGRLLPAREPHPLAEGERVRIGEFDIAFERVLDVEVTEVDVEHPSRARPAWPRADVRDAEGGSRSTASSSGVHRDRPVLTSRERRGEFRPRLVTRNDGPAREPGARSLVMQIVGGTIVFVMVVVLVVLTLL